jgi:hypothetical protein
MSHLPTLEQTSKHIKFSAAVSCHLEKASGIYLMLYCRMLCYGSESDPSWIIASPEENHRFLLL